MRRILSVLSAIALLVAAAAALPACFSPEEPACAFRCDDSANNQNRCPENYTCQADGYCHKNGTSSVCPYPDASATQQPDMSRMPDLTVPPDMTMPVDVIFVD